MHSLRGQLGFYKLITTLDANSDISQKSKKGQQNSFWVIFLAFFLLSVSNQSHSNYELKINNYAWILWLLDEGIQLPQYPHNYQSEFPSFPSLAAERIKIHPTQGKLSEIWRRSPSFLECFEQSRISRKPTGFKNKSDLFKVLLRRGCLDEPSLNEVTLQTLTGIHPLDFETLVQIIPDRCVPTLDCNRGRILGRNPDKNLQNCPCYSQSPLPTALPWNFYFFKFTQLLTVSVKEKGGNPHRKPHPLPYGFRNPYGNLKSENSQDNAQNPQWNCTLYVRSGTHRPGDKKYMG